MRPGSYRIAIIADRADIEPLFSPVVDLIELIYLQDFVARANIKAVSDVDAIGSLLEVLSMVKEDGRHGFSGSPSFGRTQLTIVGYATDLIDAQQYLSLDNLSTGWEIRVVVIGNRLALVNYRDKKTASLFQSLPVSHNVPRPCRLLNNAGEELDIPTGMPVVWGDFNRSLLDDRNIENNYSSSSSRFDLYLVRKESDKFKVTALHELRHKLIKERRSIDDVVSPDATVFFFGDSLS